MRTRHLGRFRRQLAIVVATLCCIGCTSVTAADSPENGDEKPVVVTTFSVLADIVQNVGGDAIRVESIVKPGAEIHSYEPTPSDLTAVADAILMIDHGLGLDAWFSKFVEDLKVPRVTVSNGVNPIEIDSREVTTGDAGGAGDAGAAGDVGAMGAMESAGAVNPHTWMSPKNVKQYVDTIESALARALPKHAEEFAMNARAYRDELDLVARDLEQAVARIPEAQRTLVTCEGAFSYLARDAGLSEAYLWRVNAEQQITPRQLVRLIEIVRERGLSAVFCESTVSPKGMMQVVDSTDADFGGTLYVDSLSAGDGPVPTYLDLIRHDIDTIVSGLTRERNHDRD